MGKLKQSLSVLYGGSVGFSLLHDLCRAGLEARIWSANQGGLRRLKETGGFRTTGLSEEFVSLKPFQICEKLLDAVSESEIIFLACPAFLHEKTLRQIGPALQGGQRIVLCPGRVFGAVHARQILHSIAPHADRLPIVELETVPYACRLLKDSRLALYSKKKLIRYSILNDDSKTEGLLESAFPQQNFVRASLFESSLESVGFILHPTAMLMNADRLLSEAGPFYFYTDFMTEEVTSIASQIDQERMEITKAMGLKGQSILDWFRYSYGVEAESLFSAVRSVPAYAQVLAPDTLAHRYLLEDVPFGLLPLESLGRQLGLHTPAISHILELAAKRMKTNFLEEGRSLERMKLSLQELKDLNESSKVAARAESEAL